MLPTPRWRKFARQPKASCRIPPSTGASIGARDMIAPMCDSPALRARRLEIAHDRARQHDCPAPPSACGARAAIKVSMSGATAQSALATQKENAASSTGFRPQRSDNGVDQLADSVLR